jgi:hypothetical protein
MLDRQVHLTVAQLRVTLHPVLGALYWKGANPGSLAALRQLVLAQGDAPRFDVLVQFFLVLQARPITVANFGAAAHDGAPITCTGRCHSSSDFAGHHRFRK